LIAPKKLKFERGLIPNRFSKSEDLISEEFLKMYEIDLINDSVFSIHSDTKRIAMTRK